MTSDPVPSSPAPKRSRLVTVAQAKVEPLYPATRLLKSGVLESDRLVAEAARTQRDAQAEASRILDEARTQAQTIKADAFRQGTEQGLETFTMMLKAVATEIQRLRDQFAAEVESVALMFARHLLRAELSFHPERITNLVSAVFRSTHISGDIVVHLHPRDLELVRPREQDLIRDLPFAGTVQFREDHEVPLHGIRIETDMGTYDASIESQFQRLAEILAKDRQDGRGAP
ncbi:MAG: FliH/SctL family protein [Tepidisphaeraceae bacterium]|jgi:flagellar biosynthesis/type III secretory pathway protein FliH